MTRTVPTTGIQSDTIAPLQRIRSDRQQHWSSPFAARRIHLIGVGGCGMSGLAGVLLRCGAIVSGSDRSSQSSLERLSELGAAIAIGHAPLNIPSDCDIVVYSAAVGDDNPELLEAARRGVQRLKYAEMLGRVMQLRTGIAVAGTHGKSTTTAMLAYILRQARKDPTFVIGAHVKQLGGGSGVGDGPILVAEACEYDRSFLNLTPQYATILNIEEDHLDCFDGLDAIIEAFSGFAGGLPSDGRIVINGEDPAAAIAVRDIAATVETFGFGEDATWRATNIGSVLGNYRFDLIHDNEFFSRIELENIPGRHQISNATAAAALAHHAGVQPEAIADALAEFSGAERRLTTRGEVGGILVLDDYGHHPTEIQVTIRTVREQYPDRKLWVVFQPHQHSRTRFLLSDFARSFGDANHLLVPDIYFVRDSEDVCGAICSSDLVNRIQANGGNALYLPSHEQIVQHVVAQAKGGDVVLTMGAGDVWKIADELIRRLA